MAITVTPDPKLPDDQASYAVGPESSYVLGAAVTPSDSAVSLTFLPRALTCTGAGNVCCVWKDGSNSIHSMVVGSPLRVRPYAVAATGTTATGIAALK